MRHQVTFTVPARRLESTDIEFDVKSNQEMLGTLKVSKGGVIWRPRKHVWGYFSTWEKFDDTIKPRKNHTSKRTL